MKKRCKIAETRTIRGAYILKKGGIAVDNEKKRAESKEEFEEHFMAALFDTYRHQYGECTITEVAEDKTA